MIRRHLSFKGRVQGVGFRYRACRAAEKAGVTGWVKNEPDGTVTMEVQGTEEQIRLVVDRIRESPYIRISRFLETEIPVDEGENSFGVKW